MSRYGTTSTVQIAEVTCLWYGTWRTDTVRVILVRETGKNTNDTKGYGIALITTDLTSSVEDIIARYAARWSIEVTLCATRRLCAVKRREPREVKVLLVWLSQQSGRS